MRTSPSELACGSYFFWPLRLSRSRLNLLPKKLSSKHFLSWYKTYDGSPYPDEIRKAYSKVLAGRGLAAPEVERQVASADRIAATRPNEFIALNFDKLYSRGERGPKNQRCPRCARAIRLRARAMGPHRRDVRIRRPVGRGIPQARPRIAEARRRAGH